MAHRTLELTLISAKDLKEINLIGKMDVYVEASLSGDPRSRQRTKTDVDGGKHPSWNSTLRFTVPADPGAPGTLNLVLRAEKTLGDKDVGEVHIPLKELLANVHGDGPSQIQFLSYQVRSSSSGKQRGLINLSYKLGERITAQTAAPVGYPPITKSNKSETPATAYPPAYPPANSYPQPATAYSPANSYPPPSTAYPPANSYPPPPPSEKPSKSSERPSESSGKPSKGSEPVMAYPAGSSSAPAYPYGAPPPQHGPPPPQYGAPYGYPPAQQYGYPPAQQGYGYPPQQGYGYPPQQAVKPQKNKNKLGMGLGAGLLGGAIGGLILGDMVDDVYDSGYDAGFDGGGFDF